METAKTPWDFKKYLKPWREEKIVFGLEDKSYHAEEACSSGQLMTILDRDAGLHKLYAEKTGHPRKETEALRFGSMFHKAALEGPEFLKRYRVEPVFEGKTKDGKPTTNPNASEVKEKRAAWYADLPKDTIVVQDGEELDQITGMLNALSAHPEAAELLKGGHREVSGFFNHNGFRCRVRFDLLRDEAVVVDLKTTKNARSSEFQRQIISGLYFVQAYFYLIGAAKLLRQPNLKFKFIAIEKEYPYLVSVHTVGESLLTAGDAMVTKAMSQLKAAVETGIWLPEPQIEYTAEAPKWLMDNLVEEGTI